VNGEDSLVLTKEKDIPHGKKTIRTFEDLRVWQKAIQFLKRVCLVTSQGDLKRDFGLRDQMRRAAVSVPTNIAEDFERASRKEYLLFLNIAKGSVGETRSLRVALEVGYFDKLTHDELRMEVVTLSRYLYNQISSIRNAPAKV
jgi:four helix bundle protein